MELQVFAEESDDPQKFYVGRHLDSEFRKAGLEDIKVRTFAHDRIAPLGSDKRIYFIEHLKELSDKVVKCLNLPVRCRFEALTNPLSEEFLLNAPDLTATCIDQLAWGRKCASAEPRSLRQLGSARRLGDGRLTSAFP